MIVIDPVCKMKVETDTAQWKFEHEGETYYFCAPGCMASFEKDPQQYLNGSHEDHDHAGHDHSQHEGHQH